MPSTKPNYCLRLDNITHTIWTLIIASLSAWSSMCKQSTYKNKNKPSSHSLSLQSKLFCPIPTGSLFLQVGSLLADSLTLTLLIYWLKFSFTTLCSLNRMPSSSLLAIIKCSSVPRSSSSSTPPMNSSSLGPQKSSLLCKTFIDCSMGLWLCLFVDMCE